MKHLNDDIFLLVNKTANLFILGHIFLCFFCYLLADKMVKVDLGYNFAEYVICIFMAGRVIHMITFPRVRTIII